MQFELILIRQAFGNVTPINQVGVGGLNNIYTNNSTSFNNFQNLYAPQQTVNPNQNYFNNYQQSFSGFQKVNLQKDLNQGFNTYNGQFNETNNNIQTSTTLNNNQIKNDSNQGQTTPFDFF